MFHQGQFDLTIARCSPEPGFGEVIHERELQSNLLGDQLQGTVFEHVRYT